MFIRKKQLPIRQIFSLWYTIRCQLRTIKRFYQSHFCQSHFKIIFLQIIKVICLLKKSCPLSRVARFFLINVVPKVIKYRHRISNFSSIILVNIDSFIPNFLVRVNGAPKCHKICSILKIYIVLNSQNLCVKILVLQNYPLTKV